MVPPQPRRHDLNAIFVEIMEGDEDRVYFQPPSDISMKYSAIVYERDFSSTQFADNIPFRRHDRYQVTFISRDPDDPRKDQIAALPTCLFERHFVENQLHHDVYNLYF